MTGSVLRPGFVVLMIVTNSALLTNCERAVPDRSDCRSDLDCAQGEVCVLEPGAEVGVCGAADEGQSGVGFVCNDVCTAVSVDPGSCDARAVLDDVAGSPLVVLDAVVFFHGRDDSEPGAPVEEYFEAVVEIRCGCVAESAGSVRVAQSPPGLVLRPMTVRTEVGPDSLFVVVRIDPTDVDGSTFAVQVVDVAGEATVAVCAPVVGIGA